MQYVIYFVFSIDSDFQFSIDMFKICILHVLLTKKVTTGLCLYQVWNLSMRWFRKTNKHMNLSSHFFVIRDIYLFFCNFFSLYIRTYYLRTHSLWDLRIFRRIKFDYIWLTFSLSLSVCNVYDFSFLFLSCAIAFLHIKSKEIYIYIDLLD